MMLPGNELQEMTTLKREEDLENLLNEFSWEVERVTGCEVGEHSSANDPWNNALEALGSMPSFKRSLNEAEGEDDETDI